MSIEWYRAYHGLPYDPKLQVIARRTGQSMAVVVAVWVCLLDAASRHEPRGVVETDPEEIAVTQGLELEAVEAVIAAFTAKGMIDENGKLTAWDKRQHMTSTERSQKHREAKKQGATSGNAAQRGATTQHTPQQKNKKKAPDTETDSDYRAETESKPDSYSKNRTRAEKKEREKEKTAEPRNCRSDAANMECRGSEQPYQRPQSYTHTQTQSSNAGAVGAGISARHQGLAVLLRSHCCQ